MSPESRSPNSDRHATPSAELRRRTHLRASRRPVGALDAQCRSSAGRRGPTVDHSIVSTAHWRGSDSPVSPGISCSLRLKGIVDKSYKANINCARLTILHEPFGELSEHFSLVVVDIDRSEERRVG